MNRTFRNVIFWIHLVVGVVAGLIIGVMSLTGAAIAFESQIVEWAERDARHVQAPAPEAARLPVDELLARVRAARPEAQPSGVTVYPEADAAVMVALGRESQVFVNPYTGEVKEGGAQGWRGFFHTMEELHRWLAAQGESRAVGKALTGVSNIVFLFLAVSGLYLWWPRKWALRAMRPSLWFRPGLKGKARDWNWHNVIGFWSLPVILVLTASGMVISYRWASDLVFKVTGNAPPANQGPPGGASVKVTPPAPGAERMKLDALFAEAGKSTPQWSSISLRLGGGQRPGGPQGAPGQDGRQGARGAEGGPGRGGEGSQGRGDGAQGQGMEARAAEGGRGPRDAQGPGMEGRVAESGQGPRGAQGPGMEGRVVEGGPGQLARADASAGGPEARPGEGAPGQPPAGGARGTGEARGGESRGGGGVDALTFSIRAQDAWPLFATTQVSLDPFTGQVAKQEGYADYNSGRKLRTWLRFLHTGEALGWFGQLIAAIASLGGSVLVYTGFALAWRRFFPRRNASTVSAREAAAAPVQPEPETTA